MSKTIEGRNQILPLDLPSRRSQILDRVPGKIFIADLRTVPGYLSKLTACLAGELLEGLEELRAEGSGVSLNLALRHCVELLAEGNKELIDPFGHFGWRKLLGQHSDDEKIDRNRIVGREQPNRQRRREAKVVVGRNNITQRLLRA